MSQILAISDSQVEAFEQDGAIVLRGVIEGKRIEDMRRGIEIALADRTAIFHDWPTGDQGRFYNGFFHSLRNDHFKNLIRNSALAEVAARFLRARQVNFFYDQLMVKEPGTSAETPWHLDATYFPLQGGRLLSIWIPFDPVSPDSGVVTYIKGSHRWTQAHQSLQSLPRPGEPIPNQELLTWTLEPGDILLHDLFTVHGAAGNSSTGRRRALATRWVDQDMRYHPAPNDFMTTLRKSFPQAPEPDVEPGAALDSALFPRVWPRT